MRTLRDEFRSDARDDNERHAGSRTWSRGVAAVLSFFIPGLGQIYKGQIAAGLLWMLVGALIFIGYAMFLIPIAIVPHILCIHYAYSSPSAQEKDTARYQAISNGRRTSNGAAIVICVLLAAAVVLGGIYVFLPISTKSSANIGTPTSQSVEVEIRSIPRPSLPPSSQAYEVREAVDAIPSVTPARKAVGLRQESGSAGPPPPRTLPHARPATITTNDPDFEDAAEELRREQANRHGSQDGDRVAHPYVDPFTSEHASRVPDGQPSAQ